MNFTEQNFYIIAEIGMNHDGSLGNALRLMEEAAEAGVQAVKFQMHISTEESLPSAPPPPYFTTEGRFEYFDRTAFTMDEWSRLKDFAHGLNLDFIVSPFSLKAVQILKELNVDAYKIASGEVTNLPMLEHIAATQMPILLSSGMSSWAEVASAVSALGSELKVIFQCSSQYPCPPESVGLNIIPELAERYPNIIPGFSDHTSDNISSIAAWLYGARVFEKHFTLSKNMYGPDSRFSLEPHEMKNYVDGIDYIAKAVGSSIDKDDLSKYNDMKNIFEKSIVAADELSEGTVLILEHLNFKKPGWGIRADSYKHVIGKKLKTNKKYDDLINFDDLEDA